MRKVRWMEIVGVLGIFGLAAAILFPIFGRSRETGTGPRCPSHLKQIGLGFLQYTQDYNETLPPTHLGKGAKSAGWVELAMPYIKSTQVFQCPAEGVRGASLAPAARGYTDYWMNAKLSGVSMKTIAYPTATIFGGDGNDGTDKSDSSYAISGLPSAWLASSTSPSYRHDGMANYLFLDGHVKAGKPDAITPAAGNGNWSFAFK